MPARSFRGGGDISRAGLADDRHQKLLLLFQADQRVAARLNPSGQIRCEGERRQQLHRPARLQRIDFLLQPHHRSGAREGAGVHDFRFAGVICRSFRRGSRPDRLRGFGVELLPRQVAAGEVVYVKAVLPQNPFRHITALSDPAEHRERTALVELAQPGAQFAERNVHRARNRAVFKLGDLPHIQQEHPRRNRVGVQDAAGPVQHVPGDHPGEVHRVLRGVERRRIGQFQFRQRGRGHAVAHRGRDHVDPFVHPLAADNLRAENFPIRREQQFHIQHGPARIISGR